MDNKLANTSTGEAFQSIFACKARQRLTVTIVLLAALFLAMANAAVAQTPSAPLIGPAFAGNGQIFVSFSAPASTGGSTITSYTATCASNVGANATGMSVTSPIALTGLVNNTAYNCSVTATNAAGISPASATVSITPFLTAPLTLIGVKSRKSHGTAGVFDVPINNTTPLDGLVSVEPRAIGAGHSIVFQFNATINSVGAVTATDESAAAVSAATTQVGNEVVVTLTGIANNKRVNVLLPAVNGATVNASASVGFLVGDVNDTRAVNSSDISGVKARSGQTTTGTNFRSDVNTTGAINSSDISNTKSRSGMTLTGVSTPPVATLTFPSSVNAGTANNLTVTLRDAQNAIAVNYTGTVHFTSNDPQATLPPDYTFTAPDAGAHTFSGVALRTAGTRTITATFDSGAGPTNTTASVQAAAPSVLAFVQQPTGGFVRSALTPPVSVSINDAFGNRTASTAAVGLTIAINPGNAVLTGTASRSAVSGLAIFDDLSFTNEGVGMTLQATAMGLPPVTSSTFTIIDNIAPGVISDLNALVLDSFSITLDWTAPGDDGSLGALPATASYVLKVHTSSITAMNFAGTGVIIATSAPSPVGSAESAEASGLSANTQYFIALRVDDGAGNQRFAIATATTNPCDTGYAGATCSLCANGYTSSGSTCVPICEASNPCTMPPGPSCASATSLTTFSSPGTCAPAGTTPFYSCSYASMFTDCASSGLVCSTTGGPAACRVP